MKKLDDVREREIHEIISEMMKRPISGLSQELDMLGE